MTYKALVLDIDGTLMSSQNTILDETKKALLQLQEEGIILILASGRPTAGMLQAAKELKLDYYGGYLLSYNGSIIINMKDNSTFSEVSLDLEDVYDLYDQAMIHQTGIIAYQNQTLVVPQIDPYIERESRINALPILETNQFKQDVTLKSVKCLLTAHPDHLLKVKNALQERYQGKYSIFLSEPYFLEIMPLGINKGARLLELLNELGISAAEVIACGDSYNDITLIEVAGVGVAMANACDALKHQADYITRSNNENGIVHVINRYFYNKKDI